jgi:preprotein translocase subunit SecA
VLNRLLTSVIGTRNERDIKKMRPILERITSLEPMTKRLGDAALADKTGDFTRRIERG